MSSKVLQKQTRYTYLKIEIEKLWKVKCVIVPIVVGALGSVPANLTKCLNTIGLQATIVKTIQKTVLLSSVHLIRRYLNVTLYSLYLVLYRTFIPLVHCVKIK